MKHLFLITLATTTLLLFSTTTKGDTTVYDTVGDPLVAGGEYYIVPYDYSPAGGGFSWKEDKKLLAPCPEFYVYQVKDNTDFGQPTSFHPTNSRQSTITLSTDVNIIFPEVSPPASLPFFCHSSSNVWKVDDDAKKVLLGGNKGSNSNSVFSIEEIKTGGYGINFCTSPSSCSGLGIDPTSDDQRLVVNGTNKAVPVVFEPEKIFLRNYANYAA